MRSRPPSRPVARGPRRPGLSWLDYVVRFVSVFTGGVFLVLLAANQSPPPVHVSIRVPAVTTHEGARK